MNGIMTPLHFLITTVAWGVNEWQSKRIEFLCREIEVYRRLVGDGRLKLTNDERRELGVLGKAIGLEALRELPTLVTPETILAWYRKFVARKHDHSAKRGPGRPRKPDELRALIVRLAEENIGWGYTKIMGALANLGHIVSRGTIANVLTEHGIIPAPERGKKTKWRDFLRTHWDVLGATDFFSVEVWTTKGLVTYYVLFFIELSTRRVEITGITPNPNDAFMAQAARNLVDCEDGFLRDKRYLIHDRDTKYTHQFVRILKDSGVKNIKLPRRSPNLNAYAERFVLTIKSECLNKLVLFGERSLRRAISSFMIHYHEERNHQALDNELIDGPVVVGEGEIECTERLGGLLKYYHRAA